LMSSVAETPPGPMRRDGSPDPNGMAVGEAAAVADAQLVEARQSM
jgi:hypothetical protein